MRIHTDHRRAAFCDLFTGIEGDVNVFHLHPDKPSGWHRHQYQTDQFFVARGFVVFGFWRDGETPVYRMVYAGEDPIMVAPGYWHGYEAQSPSILVMYLSQKYNPDDEAVTSFDDVPWSP